MWDDAANDYYTDADGVTEEFTSEWQAEDYRQELQEQAFTEQAKSLINDFCQSEYGDDADFSDLTKIGVAYTTVTDDEISIQVNIDLVNYRLERYLDDEHLETRQYGMNPDKTDGGELISSFACEPETVVSEFALSKREYRELTGRVSSSATRRRSISPWSTAWAGRSSRYPQPVASM